MNATKILTTAMSQRLVLTLLALMLVFVMMDTRVVGNRAAVRVSHFSSFILYNYLILMKFILFSYKSTMSCSDGGSVYDVITKLICIFKPLNISGTKN